MGEEGDKATGSVRRGEGGKGRNTALLTCPAQRNDHHTWLRSLLLSAASNASN